MNYENAVQIKHEDYIVLINTDEHTLYFGVFPVVDWIDSHGEKGTSFIDKDNEPDHLDEFQEGKCLKKMSGNYCWRGVWEGRLYFDDCEYWGEDIEELSRLYNDIIVPWCKKFIKKRNPEYNCED